MLKMSSTSLHELLNLFLYRPILRQHCSAENFPIFFSSATLIQMYWLQRKLAFKKHFASITRHDICRWLKFGELDACCVFEIICRQFACTHYWATRSIRQQSVLIFNKLLKQKLVNSFSYCLQKHYRWNYITMSSLSCQADINFLLKQPVGRRPPQYAPPLWPWPFDLEKWCPSHVWRGLRLCQ